MLKSVKRVTYQVPNLEKAREWYRNILGQEPALDSPFFVTFLVSEAALTLMPATQTSPQNDERVVAYWEVEDIEAVYRRLLEGGAMPHAEIKTNGNIRLAKVIDPFCLMVHRVEKLFRSSLLSRLRYTSQL